jgi:DNA-binding transcriptional ArsR family regulator
LTPSRDDDGDGEEGHPDTTKENPEGEEQTDVLPSITSSGPLSSSARVAILAALYAFRRTTFTELMLAVNLPKSSLNLSLAILRENKLVTVKKGFVGMGGPRTIVEITAEGEKAIRDYLTLMQSLAKRIFA